MSELIGSPRREFHGARYEKLTGEGGVVVDAVSTYVVNDFGLSEPAGETQDEDQTVSLDELGEPIDGEDVVQDIAMAAAATGKGFDGPLLAELLEGKGPIEDVRLGIAIGVLRLGSKLTGDKLLSVLEGLGFEAEVTVARLARDELAKIPDVPVESTTPLPGSIAVEDGK